MEPVTFPLFCVATHKSMLFHRQLEWKEGDVLVLHFEQAPAAKPAEATAEIAAWMSDPVVVSGLNGTGQPMSVDQLRAYRLKVGLTQDDIAWKLGFSPTTVSRWERGTAAPDLRATGARRHVREEVPFYTGRRIQIAELSEVLS